MFHSLRTGEVIDKHWLRFSFPTFWHYDVLRGLDYLRDAGIKPDSRVTEAIEIVIARRHQNGRWPLNLLHPEHIPLETETGVGQCKPLEYATRAAGDGYVDAAELTAAVLPQRLLLNCKSWVASCTEHPCEPTDIRAQSGHSCRGAARRASARTDTVRRPAIPLHGPGSRQPHRGCRRRSRRSHCIMPGAASGGVWKSTDSGKTFAPIFDAKPVQAIGALAVSRSDHNIVWAGTGEAWAIRDSDMMGDGVYKSTDAGATWTNMGLTETGRIGRIVINPTNPDIVFVCAAGRLTGPQQERGVFTTTDGGKTWTRSLFVDPDTGCSGSLDGRFTIPIHYSPAPGAWSCTPTPCSAAPRKANSAAHGPGSGVYVTHDGGATWTRIEGHGMPKPPVGKDRRGGRAKRFQARVRADSDGRPGIDLALRRRRRKLDQWKLAAGPDRPRGLLHPHRRQPAECRRGAGDQ